MFLYACNEVTPQEQEKAEGIPTGFSKYINCAVEIPTLAQWCAYNQVLSIGVVKSTESVGSVGSVYDTGIGFANSKPITKGTGITNVEQLKAIQNNLGANYYLASDIDTKQSDVSISGEFTGTLEGNGYVIYNIKLTDKPGLFASIKNATIKNLALGVVSISGKNNVGSLAGVATESIIENVAVAPMTANTAIFHIQSTGSAGGIVSLTYGGRVTGYNFGTNVKGLKEPYSYAGGLVGEVGGGQNESEAVETDSLRSDPLTKVIGFSSAQVSGNIVGGLVGITGTTGLLKEGADYKPILNGYDGVLVGIAMGNVDGLRDAGGLVGWGSGSIIVGLATGDIEGNVNHGGGLTGSSTVITSRSGDDVAGSFRVLNGIATGNLEGNGFLTGFSGELSNENYSTKAADANTYKTRTKEQWETAGLKSQVTLCMVSDYALDSSIPAALGSAAQCTEEIGRWTFPANDYPRIGLPKVITQYWDGVIE